jgi:hypothetical protein
MIWLIPAAGKASQVYFLCRPVKGSTSSYLDACRSIDCGRFNGVPIKISEIMEGRNRW